MTKINKLNRAMDYMRKSNARLIQTNHNGKPDFWITQGEHIDSAIAKQIIGHPQVIGGHDALFPGHHQTWRLRL
jgi:hypothetical protein